MKTSRESDRSYDVAVVGGGIAGLTTALLLARAGRSVVVLEAREAGAGTTGRSTGKVSLLQGTKLARAARTNPSAVVRQYVVFDGLVHGWDLSTALGLPYAPPADVVAAVQQALPALVPDPARDGDTFAAALEAPDGASPLEQVVAFSGRKVS